MHLRRILITAAISAALASTAIPSHAAGNEEAVKRHFAALVAGAAAAHAPANASASAELTLFFTMMPKGGDLHHHYSGAIYAEQYLQWVDQQQYCVNKGSYTIEVDAARVAAERAKPAKERNCLSGQDTLQDNTMLTELLQRWATKDFYNHSGQQTPPDRTFFDTFGYFGAVASNHGAEGLRTLKQRAINENLSYIETVYEIAPLAQYKEFDQAVLSDQSDAALQAQFGSLLAALDKDAAWNGWLSAYDAGVNSASAGIDDEQFTMRYQPFVLRFLSPSQVFSGMVSGFKLAKQNPKVVGVNIVGQESTMVSMRDYTLHMRMFAFLKKQYPDVKLALHAGELALGMVPPEGLQSHIAEAVHTAGAARIGHGMDIVHERNALALMKTMKERDIAVEVNLTSNEFILGIKGEQHPVTVYRKYGVPFVLATDDAGVSRNNLSNEYALYATRYKAGYGEVKKLSYDSIRYAFLPEKDKQRLLKSLDARFVAFEKDVASALQTTKK